MGCRLPVPGNRSLATGNSPRRSCRHWLAMPARPVAVLHRVVRITELDAIVLADAVRVLAGRETEDVRRARADVADVLLRQPLQLRDVDALALEQRALHRAAERVLADAAGRRHHAMARHDERHDILRD